MDISYLGLLVLIIIGVMFLRSFLVDTKKIVIPKWLDFSMAFIIVLLTIYVVYDTFFVYKLLKNEKTNSTIKVYKNWINY